jgi:hypothetical protein
VDRAGRQPRERGIALLLPELEQHVLLRCGE